MSGRIRNQHPRIQPPKTTRTAPKPKARGTAANTAATWGNPAGPKSDAFDAPGVGRAAAAGTQHGGLPDVLLTTRGGVPVNHGTDPGDYYCEHMFFSAQASSLRSGSSVASNREGEKLVGFLHLPRDGWSEGAGGAYTQEQRHAGTREVIGAAVRGYYDAAAAQVHEGPIRMLMTGYGPFSSMTNNPTGDFVTHRENLDAAMRNAFGDNLVSNEGRRVSGDGDDATYQYQVRDPSTGRERSVVIDAVRMPVSDEAIDGSSPRSVQQTMERFRPHAVISMGVNPGGSTFLAEHHADDGGLRNEGGRQIHDDASTPRNNLGDNYSLPRAINGGGAPRVAAADLSASAVGVRG